MGDTTAPAKGACSMRHKIYALLLLAPLVLDGCSAYKNMNRQEDCEKVIKDYSKLIRWQEQENASLAFVDKKQQPDFNKAVEKNRRRGLSIADFRILAKQCMSDKKMAKATVEFDYYVLPDNRVKTVTDYQTWIYREENEKEPDLGEGWKLTSPLPEFK
jgi:hypothetical protein